MSEPEFNPYTAPQTTNLESVTIDSESESLRRYCLSHETSVRSVALLYFMGGGFCLLTVISLFFIGLRLDDGNFVAGSIEILSVALYGGLGIFQLAVAFGLRRLTLFGRIGGTALAVIGLIGIPVGTIISGYVLYLLWSRKGQIVFSPRYAEVIRETPHIKFKTSIIVKVLLVILLLFLALMVTGLMFSR